MDYKESGVDISAADAAKARIKSLARATANPGVLSEIGSFGGMFRPELSSYREPVLVSSTDGVGSKIKVAIAAGVHDTVGYDLVAHCVDDILVQGAVPLFFLDYLAVGRMDPERVEQIVSGVSRACRELRCPLIGGETAEMPDTYAPDDYDLAGFIVGVVERERALTGARVRAGDVLLGLNSSGLHTNGYTLARRVLFDRLGLTVDTHVPDLGTTIGRALLAPHRSYLDLLEPLLQDGRIRALVHITGGGFAGNIPRILPDGLGADVRLGSWEVPPLFQMIQREGEIPDADMYRTFNMGIGMIVVLDPADLDHVHGFLKRRGEAAQVIGTVTLGRGVRLE